jgi:hypothetical protein
MCPSQILAAAFLAMAGSAFASDVTLTEVAGCRDKLPHSKSSEVRAVHRDGDVLVVSVVANTYCGGVSARQPEAHIAAKSVALSWAWIRPDVNVPLTACICSRHLEFRVSGAPAGELTITAEPRRQ